ncbi:MAG TPA: ROK family protein [Opitutaceae bacterium]|nr:ROK family protein [Opitutaceae bacterium]
MNVLGIDIGGSAVKGAPVDTVTGRLLAERFRVPTDKVLTPAQMARTIAGIAKHFSWNGAVGVGFPGVIRRATILTSANLHRAFIGCDGGKLFGKALKLPVSLINDADAAGLAEVRFGAGKKAAGTVLMLTFGTGVGSALFVDGRLYPNSELGHLPMKGRDAEKRVSAAAKERKKLSFRKWAHRVNDYLRVVEAILNPDRIIVGGGISKDFEEWFKFLDTTTPIVPAKFFNEAGIVGAALHAADRQDRR